VLAVEARLLPDFAIAPSGLRGVPDRSADDYAFIEIAIEIGVGIGIDSGSDTDTEKQLGLSGPNLMHRDELQRAFVLHRRDFSNTSLIVEVFTDLHGRLPLMAKGAKRGRAPLASLLQPFQPLWVAWSGRGEIRTLTRAEAAGRALPLTGTTLYCGLYVNELLLRLLGRDDPHEDLFPDYQLVLDALSRGEAIQTRLRRFELRLLDAIGYRVILDQEADGGPPVRRDGHYRYITAQGLVPAAAAGGDACVSGETLNLLMDGAELTGHHAREARDLMRAVLAPYLGERPLKSRELFRRPESTRAAAVTTQAPGVSTPTPIETFEQ
jgi:DNA repair protein RecO (recombination protein O)